ncbi:hypothetical protein [Pseudomonas fluorescens]
MSASKPFPVILLDLENLPELEAIDRLAAYLGVEAFTVVANYLAQTHAVSPVEDQISIPRLQSDALIGISDAPFEVLRLLAERFGRRELCVQESTFTLPRCV